MTQGHESHQGQPGQREPRTYSAAVQGPLEQSHTYTVVLEAYHQKQPQVPSQGEEKQHPQILLCLGVKATVRCGDCEAPCVICSPFYTELYTQPLPVSPAASTCCESLSLQEEQERPTVPLGYRTPQEGCPVPSAQSQTSVSYLQIPIATTACPVGPPATQ